MGVVTDRAGLAPAAVLQPMVAAARGALGGRAGSVAAVVVAVLAGLLLPGALGGSALLTAQLGLVFVIAAFSVVIVTGWTGEVSLAPLAFAGVGAFTMARLTSAQVGAPMILAIAVAVSAAAVSGLLVGQVAARLRGVRLTVLSLAVAQALEGAAFSNRSLTGSANGVLVNRPVLGPFDLGSDRVRFQLLLACVVVVGLLIGALRRTTAGRRMLALRAPTAVVAARGIDADAAMLGVMTLSAALAGLAGCMLGLVVGSVGPASFTPLQSALLLGLVVVCGVRSLWGAVAAGILYAALPQLLERLGDSTAAARSTTLVAGIALLAGVVLRERLGDLVDRAREAARQVVDARADR